RDVSMIPTMNIAPAGDHAMLIELDRSIAAADLHAAAANVRARDGVLACIVGHSSLYVVFTRWGAGVLTGAAEDSGAPLSNRKHVIPVKFDGVDLNEFLKQKKLTLDAFTKNIPPLIVRYLGFRGGFAYLDGWPKEWAMPRR